MRDHIVSHKNDHGASYQRYGVLQWWSQLKISFCDFWRRSVFDFCNNIGTNRTNDADLLMSVVWSRPEVTFRGPNPTPLTDSDDRQFNRPRCRPKTRPSVERRYPMPGREAIGALELARHMALVGKACVQRGFREAEA